MDAIKLIVVLMFATSFPVFVLSIGFKAEPSGSKMDRHVHYIFRGSLVILLLSLVGVAIIAATK